MFHWLTIKLLPVLCLSWLLAWPIKPEWVLVASDVQIVLDGRNRCAHHTACCADGYMHLNPTANHSGRSLRDIYLHEMQHHFQEVSGIADSTGGYDMFIEALRDAIQSGRYTDKHVVRTMKAMTETWAPEEAHADLPLLLDGKIPPEVAKWYPWFETFETDE